MTGHARALLSSLGQILRTPLGAALTALVIGIALALPTALYALLANVQDVTGGWEGRPRVSLFLRTDVPRERAVALAGELRGRDGVAEVELVDRAEALAEYRAMSGVGGGLEVLDENPLPHVLVVTPPPGRQGPEAMAALRARLADLAEVELAQLDLAWVTRLQAITAFVERAVYLLAALLAIAVLVIVGNTIRLAIAARQEEIEVALLFGATAAFIRRPFLYSGLLLGMLGGALAWALVGTGFALLAGPVQRLAELYGAGHRLDGIGPAGGLALVALGGALGLGGSWVAVGRHLARHRRRLFRHPGGGNPAGV